MNRRAAAGIVVALVALAVGTWWWRRPVATPATPQATTATPVGPRAAAAAREVERAPRPAGPCAIAVTGTVRDVSGGVVPQARVTHGAELAVSDDAGAYRLCLARAGRITLKVSADGYGAREVSVSVHGEARRDLELGLEAILEGRVLDEADRPVPGVLVQVVTARPVLEWPPVFKGTALSGPEGRFRIAGLAAGRYRVTAIADTWSAPDWTPVLIQTGPPTQLVVRVRPSLLLRGLVLQGTRPLAGVTITVFDEHQTRSGVSDDEGSVSIAGILPGIVRVTARGHNVIDPREVTIGPDLREVTIHVVPRPSIRGRVLRRGQPVAGASVTTQFDNIKTVSGADGSYALTGLGRETLSVGAEKSDLAYARPHQVVMGDVDVTLDLELDLAAAVEGVVVDRNGAPVAGVLVEVELPSASDAGLGNTDRDGRFQIHALSGGGVYQVQVGPGGDRPGRYPIVSGGEVEIPDASSAVTAVRVVVDVVNQPVAGRLVFEDGTGVPDVRVVLLDKSQAADLPGNPQHLATVTRADGRFRFEDVPAGDYVVRAEPAAGARVTQAVTAGGPDVVLTLATLGVIEGSVDPAFGPEPRISVGGPGVELYATVVDGRFRVEGVPRAAVVVRAEGNDRQGEARVQAEPPLTRVNLAPEPVRRVAGRVVDGAGAPVADARCVIMHRLGRPSRTDAKGQVELVVPVGVEVPLECYDLRARGAATIGASATTVTLVLP